MEGFGEAHGAITVLNALATGVGAAIGVDLSVKAFIKKSNETSLITKVNNQLIKIDDSLVQGIIKFFREKYGLRDKLNIEIISEIPPSKGLKSSSAVANSLIIALFDYLGIGYSEEEVLKINVEVSRKTGVSITGALDDASASLLGGLIITNNNDDIIIKRIEIGKYRVLIMYPDYSIETRRLIDINFKPIKPLIEELQERLLAGEWIKTSIFNGIIYSSYLGISPEPIYKALSNNVLTAGLSGTGPAFYTITEPNNEVNPWKMYRDNHFIETYTR